MTIVSSAVFLLFMTFSAVNQLAAKIKEKLASFFVQRAHMGKVPAKSVSCTHAKAQYQKAARKSDLES
jgi:hypothetical protein